MRTNALLTSLAVVVCGVCAAGEPFVADLLPRPQQIELTEGAFAFDPAQLPLELMAPTPEAATRLSGHLDEMLKRLGIVAKPRVETGDAFRLAVARPPEEEAAPATLPGQALAEGYECVVTPSGAAVRAESEPGLFYGMQTLGQLLSAALARRTVALPCLRIVDWPALRLRGYHEDYGRDQLPTIEDHKRSIRTVAEYKMNTYLWFIEPDHFVYDFDPELSTEYDRFRFEEIGELVRYAHDYYIEVIPVVELLGHMEMTLRHERYRPLAEMETGGGDLCATSDEAFDLVRHMVSEIAPAFGGRYFHCGLDESYAIGKGRSAEAVTAKGIVQVFADYYTRMDDLVKSQGQTMMMYADIVLNHPDILPLLPKDIVMMFWDYAPRDHYPGLDTLKQSGYAVTALSGLWDWNNLYPRYPASFRNMEVLAAQARDVGALGHFVSSWGDGYRGAAGINLSELNTYGFVYCGSLSWNPTPIPMPEYSEAFALQFFGVGSPEFAQALTRLARCQGDGLERNCQPRFVFHTDPRETVRGMMEADDATRAFWKHLKDETAAVHGVLSDTAPSRNADCLRSIDLAARMLNLSADMALACGEVARASTRPELELASFAERFDQLATTHRALWDEYQSRWTATNRPLNLAHIGRVWNATTDGLSTLAADLRAGTFQVADR